MRPFVVVLAFVLVAGCAAGPSPSPAPSVATTASPAAPSVAAVASASASPADAWAEDLAFLDEQVRTYHPDPFAINPESAWTATLADLKAEGPGATPEAQLAQLSRLVGLLDTHSWISGVEPFHGYPLLFYKFSDGWFTIRARDKSLIGTRLVSIDGTPVDDIEAAFRPLMPHDNESGFLDAVQGAFSFREYLQGIGVVDDPASVDYILERPDGTTVTATLAPEAGQTWEQELGVVGDLMGDAPEAVARRTEPVWWRTDKKHRTLLLSFNDYDESAIARAALHLQSELRDGKVDRVVLDMRYLRGGNGSAAEPLISALTLPPEFQKPGALTVLIGRENVSAGTLVAGRIDHGSEATFVGEETPARADNFLCDCHDIRLPNAAFTVTVPTFTLHSGDTRDSIPPDVPMSLSSADFFAGKDPVLDAAMAGKLPSP